MQNLAPPTIAYLQKEGVQGVRVWCLNRACQHYAVVSFDAIDTPPDFRFVDLAKMEQLVCRECGSHAVYIMPDWPHHKSP